MKVTVTHDVESSKEVEKILDTILHIQNEYGEKIHSDNMYDTLNLGMLTAWILEIGKETKKMEMMNNDI